MLTPVVFASSPSLPKGDTANLLRDPQLLSRDDINLSGGKFLQAWLSTTDERERMKANMYMLGVFDATEGQAWCSYKKSLPGSLRESIYDFFKALPSERLKERASGLITEALSKELPCKNGGE